MAPVYSDQDSKNLLLQVPRPVKTYHTETYDRISPKHFDGKGKTILITAGATGIGYAIAYAFAEAGVSRIAIVQRSADVLEKAKAELTKDFPKLEVITYQASIQDAARMKEAFSELSVDVLVLSATSTHSFKPDTPLSGDILHETTYKTNIVASYDLVDAYLKSPKASADSTKTVINITSASAQLTIPGQIGYASSKAAFAKMMQHFSLEHSPEKDGVRLFNLHPGAIYTPYASTEYGPDDFPWEDIMLPAHFSTWLGLSGQEAEFLHGRFMWSQWDVDELIQLKEQMANPFYLTIGLVL
ncbi:hypothetical protein LTR86_000567 [Recurvomyces mirabilis]|nr:hypothetical protein LTR86_000567 [Recurvomyces mirabilis]